MDRNLVGLAAHRLGDKSLSARRAWIEIRGLQNRSGNSLNVALRKESVDRNCEGVSLLRKITMSLSARRAWIEINKEPSSSGIHTRRSPQGERG